MNLDFKRLIYTVVTICFVFLIIRFFLSILPYLLIAGVVIYAVIKIKGFLYLKKNKKNDSINVNSNNNHQYSSNNNEFYSEDNVFSGEIIDVDYEESDENK